MAAEFTPTQLRLLAVLNDGLPHSRRELCNCVPNDMTSWATIKVHLSNIRKKIRPRGEDVLCVVRCRRIHYQLVRLLPPAAP